MKTYDITTLPDLTAAAEAILRDARAHTGADARVILGLSGELGTGKTTFVKELARLLGVPDEVTSPTFTIMKRYDANRSPFTHLIHIDAYRIESVDELRVLGFSDILQENNTMICIEWPERAAALLPEDTITLTFDLSPDGRRTLSASYAEER